MGKYIVFDGMDGSGKGTQIELLKKKFVTDSNSPFVFVREPGGTPFAEKIREVILDPLAGGTPALTQLLLLFAAREELIENKITPLLLNGDTVFSDRADSSTFAFQIYGEQHLELKELFFEMRELVYTGRYRRKPELYIILDLPAEIARERVMRDAKRTPNHFDARDLDYYERVRKGFKEFATYAPVEFINAIDTPASVFKNIVDVLRKEGF